MVRIPQTGDHNEMMIYVILMIVALIGMVTIGVMMYLRKKTSKDGREK